MRKALALAFATVLVFCAEAFANGGKEPYSVSVWARMVFGPDGKPAQMAIVDEDKYPAKFIENVKLRLARASIRPPEVDGKPVSLRSGVELVFTVTPTDQGGTVRVDGISMGAMPVRRYMASYPKDIEQSAGWEGEASALCKIAVDGRCSSITVSALPGMPLSVRRYMTASLENWLFEPQEVDGKAIEGEYRLTVRFNTLEGAPEDFREDKFLRLLRSRP